MESNNKTVKADNWKHKEQQLITINSTNTNQHSKQLIPQQHHQPTNQPTMILTISSTRTAANLSRGNL